MMWISFLVGVGIALLPQLFPVCGESDVLGVLKVLLRRSKWTRWLNYQVIKESYENTYLDNMEARMDARRHNSV